MLFWNFIWRIVTEPARWEYLAGLGQSSSKAMYALNLSTAWYCVSHSQDPWVQEPGVGMVPLTDTHSYPLARCLLPVPGISCCVGLEVTLPERGNWGVCPGCPRPGVQIWGREELLQGNRRSLPSSFPFLLHLGRGPLGGVAQPQRGFSLLSKSASHPELC